MLSLRLGQKVILGKIGKCFNLYGVKMFSQPFRLGRKGTIRDNPISSKHSLLDIRIDAFQSRKGQSCEIYIFSHVARALSQKTL